MGRSRHVQTSLRGLDTLVDFYSVGKAFLALCVLQLVDAGLVALDKPDRPWCWLEFVAVGKEAATLRHALCHRAAVPAIREPLTNDDLWLLGPHDRCSWRQPNHGEKGGPATPITRTRTGTSSARWSAGSVAKPCGSVWPPLHQTARCRRAHRRSGGTGTTLRLRVLFVSVRGENDGGTLPDVSALEGDQLMEMLSYFNPPGYSSMGVVNTWKRARAAQVPSTNGHGTACGVACVYDALLQPGLLLSTELLSEAVSPQSEGYCPILHEEVTFGLGFKPTVPRRPFGPNPNSFGHFGTGGAVGFADPDAVVSCSAMS